MKTFLAFLISCLTLSAATTYPVLTDSTNRLFPGGVTNVFFLNSNIVTTGTMRATGALTLTNSGNIFAGDGSGLTGISAGISTSGGSATNLSLYSSGTTNRPLRVYGTNGTDEAYVDKDAAIVARIAYSGGNQTAFKWSTSVFDPYVRLGIDAGTSVVFGTYAGTDLNLIAQSAIVAGASAGGGWFFGSSKDVHFRRIASGTLALDSGTDGAYRDLVSRSLYATNIYATNLIINGGATVTKILSATATLNFDLTALTVEDLTITVTGAADGDVVTLGVPNGSVTTSVQYTAWVSAADTVTVRARTSAVGENPASGTFRATIFKH